MKHVRIANRRIAFAAVASILCTMPVFASEFISVPSVGVTTIGQAMINAESGDTVWVSDGVYSEKVFIKSGVVLAARNALKVKIDGGGKGTVVTLSANCTLNGFEITGGTIGVFSKDDGNTIVNCRITGNWGTGIIAVRHLPKIEDNIIVFNRATGIQGWDIRPTNNASINHNTIAFNGNNGIALGGRSEVTIQNNLITFNERLGVKLSAKSEISKLFKNNLFANLQTMRALPADNYSFDPKFRNPRTKLDFKLESNQPCCMYGSDNQILGSRIVGNTQQKEGM
jgi:hypothetical protein